MELLEPSRICEQLLFPLFFFDPTRKKGSHCGLAVLQKEFATLRVYDFLQMSFTLEDSIRHVLALANSIGTRFSLTNEEWPATWTRSGTVYSVQQGNGYDCGISTMLNAFYDS